MKQLRLVVLLMIFGLPVFAETEHEHDHEHPELPINWELGTSLMSLSEGDEDLDRNMNAFVISLGYRIELMERVFAIPDIRIGKGAANESATLKGTDIDITLDNFIALSLKSQFELENGIYVFLVPSYANAGFMISSSQKGYAKPAVEDSWMLGIGAGAGYYLVKNISAEFMFEQFDDKDIATLGFKFYY